MTTRQEAIAKGLKLYTSAMKKCVKHPHSPRRVSNGNCHACICERMSNDRNKKRLSERKAEKRKTPRVISTGGLSPTSLRVRAPRRVNADAK
jgi:hypothetical protein